MNLVGLAGIIVWHLIPGRRSNTRLVVQIVFFAVMTVILVGNDLTPFKSEASGTPEAAALLVISARLLWWIHLAWAIIGAVRIYLVLEGRPREARLLQDIVIGVVYLGVALSILAFVFGIPIGTLVATSGVVAIILGLALQNTLSDVFSGIALTLGRPYVIGDWIVLSDGIEGRVVESTWRSTHILTGSNNVVILPNSFLARLGLTNVSRPDGTHLLTLKVRVAPTRMPSVVAEVMQSVLLSCSSIVQEPPPTVALKGLDAVALEVELQFRVANPAKRTRARSEVLDLVYRHCKSAGLLLAMPAESLVAMADLPTEETARPPRIEPIELIEAIPIFAALTRGEKALLAVATSAREYHKGEIIVRQGDILPALMMIRAGVIVMRHEGEEVGRLAPGDFFGETGLLAGMGEASTLEALTRVTVYEIDQNAFAPLLADRPAVAEDLALSLTRRSLPGRTGEAHGQPQEHHVHLFHKAIQRIFHRGRHHLSSPRSQLGRTSHDVDS
ncbi:mechanosensitive ion channel family protein [Vineibacter terrae]|uniref:mechanosensitive ion channel family protein n=1 Tax=Vineibacter terrae TaxID=2586908 RepID=UPI002E2FAF16|nr:mechanosensitive ion channel family protein [Vineibacter terrae]HEX2891736.1 mechanosensitive ion channel family protein [Vineibacter terrae]